MKTLGFILIAIGAALLVFIAYNFLAERNRFVSPVPEDRGVKVIFITPTK